MSRYIFNYSLNLWLELTWLHLFYNYHNLGALGNVCIAEGLTTISPKIQIFQDPNRAANLKKFLSRNQGLIYRSGRDYF
jgi:hypothetical protein